MTYHHLRDETAAALVQAEALSKEDDPARWFGFEARIYLLAAPEGVEIMVLDVRGRVVQQIHRGPASDGQRFAVETAGLAPGAYVVRAVSASGTATAGLTVAR